MRRLTRKQRGEAVSEVTRAGAVRFLRCMADRALAEIREHGRSYLWSKSDAWSDASWVCSGKAHDLAYEALRHSYIEHVRLWPSCFAIIGYFTCDEMAWIALEAAALLEEGSL